MFNNHLFVEMKIKKVYGFLRNAYLFTFKKVFLLFSSENWVNLHYELVKNFKKSKNFKEKKLKVLKI